MNLKRRGSDISDSHQRSILADIILVRYGIKVICPHIVCEFHYSLPCWFMHLQRRFSLQIRCFVLALRQRNAGLQMCECQRWNTKWIVAACAQIRRMRPHYSDRYRLPVSVHSTQTKDIFNILDNYVKRQGLFGVQSGPSPLSATRRPTFLCLL